MEEEEFTPLEIEGIEMAANVQITAVLDFDQYATLVSRIVQYLADHPEDAEADRCFKTIKFTRTR